MMALARALVPTAHRALCLPVARPGEDEPVLAAALDAIDGFLAEPVASRFLTATRALRDLTRLRRRTVELERLARSAIDAELQRLDELALLPPAAQNDALDVTSPIELLRSLPPDPRAARRMQALSALLSAHRALAARVRAPETHRARMTVPTTTQKATERRGTSRRARR